MRNVSAIMVEQNSSAAFPARDNQPSARRSRQRTMFDTAKSGAVQMQKIALKAATEAASAAAEVASAAAEATVQAVMRTSSRENASRGRRATPKRGKTARRAARKKRH